MDENKPLDSNPEQSGGAEDVASNMSEAEQGAVVKFVKETLGRDVSDFETAQKVVKDINSYTGKLGSENKQLQNELEALKQQADPSNNVMDKISSLEKKLERNEFYEKHPEFKNHNDLVETYAQKHGGNMNAVLEDESFKSIFEKVTEHDKQVSSRSVLESNARLGQATDTISSAKEDLKSGNVGQAGDKAVDAVLKSLGS